MQNESPRRSWKVALAGIVACALAVASARAQDLRTIEGQIFIRTKGGENIKLSLVDVLLFDEKVIATNLESKRKFAEPFYETLQPAVKAAKRKMDETAAANGLGISKAEKEAYDAWRKISGQADYTHSALYYFNDLPAALQSTKTDADGKFSFKVQSGSYVLVSVSSRSAGAHIIGSSSFPITEHYHWMVRVRLDADKKVMLANDNLSTGGSADSLIRTLDRDTEYIETAMQSGGAAIFKAFVEGRKRALANAEANANAANAARPAQLKALELYPELGVADSPLNKEFVERVRMYRIEKKEFFAEPDWPVRLAKECSEALAGKPAPK
jgi:hypothetical protein